LFHAGLKDMTKLKVAFRNFANAAKKEDSYTQRLLTIVGCDHHAKLSSVHCICDGTAKSILTLYFEYLCSKCASAMNVPTWMQVRCFVTQ
jgi:hypothetical protein